MDKLNLPGSSPYFGVGTGFSRGFQALIKDIGDAKSKYDEEKIVKKDLARLRETIGLPSVSMKENKENMIRLVYGYMLGYDVSFGQIHVINLAGKSSLMEKRVGYLTLSLLLNEKHQLALLLMNTIQKDLTSNNILAMTFGLTAASRLVSQEMLPMILPIVLKLTHHDREVIRKKAFCVLYRFHRLDPDNVQIDQLFQQGLCDHDPSVLGAILNGYLYLVQEDRNRYKSITATLVSVVKQVLESRIPADFSYHGVPAPWLLLRALQILAELGADDLSCSQEMYEVLGLCFDKVSINSNIGCAVVHECMKTITAIYPDQFLINMVLNRLSSFFSSKANNMKYIGINMLGHLIAIDIRYSNGYQSTVIDSLSDADETLKRKTLDLLYQMTNSSNVVVVCEKLLGHLRSTVDTYFRTNLVTRITKLAERFAPSVWWYVKTINEMLELAGNVVNSEVAYDVMRQIGEGLEDPNENDDLIANSVSHYMALTEKPSLPDILTQLASWVIGEYACSSGMYRAEDVLERLVSLLKRKHSDLYTRSWVLSAIMKVFGQTDRVPPHIIDEVRRYSNGMGSDFSQRCSEALAIATMNIDLTEIVPLDSSCEAIEVEPSLAFLEETSQRQIANGASPYSAEWRRSGSNARKLQEYPEAPKINFTPYPLQKPTFGPNPSVDRQVTPPKVSSEQLPLSRDDVSSSVGENTKLKPWTSSGYFRKDRRSSESTDVSDSTSEAESVKEETKGASSTRSSSAELPNNSMQYIDKEKQKLAAALFGGPSTSDGGESNYSEREADKPTGRSTACELEYAIEENWGLERKETLAHKQKNNCETKSTTRMDALSIDDLLVYNEGVAESNINNITLSPGNTEIDEKQVQEAARETEHVMTLDVENGRESSSHVDLLMQANDEIVVETDTGSETDISDSIFGRRKDLISDENVRLSVYKTIKPDELLLIIYITNQTSTNLYDVKLTIKEMSNLNLQFIQSESMMVSFHILSPRRTVQCDLSITYKAPAKNMTLAAEFVYKDKANNSKLLLPSYELSYFDFIRALKIDSDQFKERWLTVGLLEVSKTLKLNELNMEDALEKLQSEAHFHVVDADKHDKEIEILAAGSILETKTLLLYLRLSRSSANVLIRSSNNLLNQCLWLFVESMFKTAAGS